MSEQKPISAFGQAFISYGSYHFDMTNRIIHIFCIPVIAATLIAILSYVPLRITLFSYSLGL